jgi:integrase
MYIEKKGESLRLRWMFEGRRYNLALGLKDSPINRTYAKQVAAQIEIDMQAGYFDRTLLKYRPRTLGTNASNILAVELFEKYSTAMIKDKNLAPGSIHRYQAIAANLKRYLGEKPAHLVTVDTAKDMAAAMSENLAGQTTKTYLFLLKSCWDWAAGKYHLSELNPWNGLTSRVKVHSQQPKQPFTTGEITAILSAFYHHPHYSHYADFALFLVGTACRFGEAAGLRWEHLSADFVTAWIGESISRGNRKDTKTGKARTVVLSVSVRSMLTERAKICERQGLVFTSPKGLPMNDHRFRARAWKQILEECRIEYRSPYNLRHTTISHTLATGVSPIALAEQTGHDKKVLLSTYAHAIDTRSLFPDFCL